MTLSLTERQTLNFINDYKRCTALWDPSEKDYTNKLKRRAAYSALCHKYNMDLKVLKSKIKNLRSYFLKEQQKMMLAGGGDGGEGGGGYESPWFAYDAMSFIGNLGTSRTAKDLQLDYAMYNGAAEEGVEIVGEQDVLDEAVLSTGMLVQVETEAEAEEQEVEEVEEEEFPVVQTDAKPSGRRLNLKRKLAEADDQTIGFFSKSAFVEKEKDECVVFGEMVAFQLRSLGPRNRAIARNKIQNVIFELEMQELDLTNQEQEISFDGVEVKCDRL